MSIQSTILVPTDFRHPSLDALAMAKTLGAQLGHAVVLLHVYTIPVSLYPGFDPIPMPGLPEQIGNAAKETLQKLSAASGDLATVLRAGDPATEILQVVEDLRPTMVVMGTHGRRGLSHLLLGSVTEHVLRACRVPVLTVRAPDDATA